MALALLVPRKTSAEAPLSPLLGWAFASAPPVSWQEAVWDQLAPGESSVTWYWPFPRSVNVLWSRLLLPPGTVSVKSVGLGLSSPVRENWNPKSPLTLDCFTTVIDRLGGRVLVNVQLALCPA